MYLSPHFPSNYQAFCERLRELGVTVLGLADEPYDKLDPKLQRALHEYYRVEDMHDYDQLLRACGHFTHRHGKIDRIDSHAEYWLETEAHLRTDFNIPGIKNDTIQTIKRKSCMKQVFRDAGIPVARGQVCRMLVDALAFAEEIGYPVVAKPDIGVGAAATYPIHNRRELEALYNDKPPQDYILEEYVIGDIYSFDGLVDRDGVIRFCTSHRYSQGVMEAVLSNNHIYYYSLREIPADLEEAGRRLVSAFNVRERFFHFEFFRKHQDQQLVALEVNIRPPGGLTTDMFNFANDFDIYKEWANIVVNNRFEADWSRPYHVIYIGRKNHMPYAHSHEDVMTHYSHLICHTEPISGIFAQALGNHGYLARSPQVEELLALADYSQQLRQHETSAA